MKRIVCKKLDKLLLCLFIIGLFWQIRCSFADTAVIGNSNVPPVTAEIIQKIFTGRSVVVEGVSVTPVNAKQGSEIRNQFLQTFLHQNEEKYQAYWTVRQFVGKGRQPRSLNTSQEIIDFCKNNKGGIGYISAAETTGLPTDVKVLIKK